MNVSDIRYRRRLLVGRRNTLRTELTNTEHSYETLVEFNKSTAGYRDSFEQANSSKSVALEELSGFTENCKTASRYYEGMNELLDGNGGKLVTIAYGFLLATSKSKLSYYWQRILELEDEIAECNRQIGEYDLQIEEIENKLKEDGVVGG